jgi:hypothetical protein
MKSTFKNQQRVSIKGWGCFSSDFFMLVVFKNVNGKNYKMFEFVAF